MISFAELVAPQTVDDIRATYANVLSVFGIDISRWRKGGIMSSFLTATATVHAGFTQWQAAAIAGGFLDFATGDWLRILAKYGFSVDYLPATFATGLMTLTNTGGGLYTQAAGSVTVADPDSGIHYTNDSAFTLNPGQTLTGIPFTATTLGAVGSAAPGSITELVTTMLGVTVTNPAVFVGADDEADESLRTRCRQKLATLSPNGPKDAYSFIAKSSATSQPITRVNVVTDKTTGFVYVYLANAGGVPNASDVNIVAAAIGAVCEPLCITAIVLAGTPRVVPVTYRVWIQNSALTVAQATATINQALIKYFAGAPLGGVVLPPATGKVYQSAIEGVIYGAVPGIGRITFDTPSADVSIGVGEIPTLGVVSANVTLVTSQ